MPTPLAFSMYARTVTCRGEGDYCSTSAHARWTDVHSSTTVCASAKKTCRRSQSKRRDLGQLCNSRRLLPEAAPPCLVVHLDKAPYSLLCRGTELGGDGPGSAFPPSKSIFRHEYMQHVVGAVRARRRILHLENTRKKNFPSRMMLASNRKFVSGTVDRASTTTTAVLYTSCFVFYAFVWQSTGFFLAIVLKHMPFLVVMLPVFFCSSFICSQEAIMLLLVMPISGTYYALDEPFFSNFSSTLKLFLSFTFCFFVYFCSSLNTFCIFQHR